MSCISINWQWSIWKRNTAISGTTLKTTKYLGINLTNEVQDLYPEFYKTVKRNWRRHRQMERHPCSLIRINTIKMLILPKAMYSSKWALLKVQWCFSQKKILKFARNQKRPWIAKAILRNKNKAGGIILLDFKLYYKAIVKTVRVLI